MTDFDSRIDLDPRIERAMRQMHALTGELPQRFETPVMLYRVDARHPDQIAAEGGFYIREGAQTNIRNSMVSSGENEGLVDFTLHPQVAVKFREKGFLYAVPVEAGYIMAKFTPPENEWKQEISTPGIALPEWWSAREYSGGQWGDTQLGARFGHDADKRPEALHDPYRALFEDPTRIPHLPDLCMNEDYPSFYQPSKCDFYAQHIEPVKGTAISRVGRGGSHGSGYGGGGFGGR